MVKIDLHRIEQIRKMCFGELVVEYFQQENEIKALKQDLENIKVAFNSLEKIDNYRIEIIEEQAEIIDDLIVENELLNEELDDLEKYFEVDDDEDFVEHCCGCKESIAIDMDDLADKVIDILTERAIEDLDKEFKCCCPECNKILEGNSVEIENEFEIDNEYIKMDSKGNITIKNQNIIKTDKHKEDIKEIRDLFDRIYKSLN